MKINHLNICHTLKKIVLPILFIILLLFITYYVMIMFQPKESFYKYENYFAENNEEYDVMFFGSSHTENFFNPMVLWKDYGITSYNFGNPEEPISVTYWTIRNAVHMKKPKVVVVDLYMYNRELESRDFFNEKVHYSLDYFPITTEKIAAVTDLSNSKEEFVDKFFTLSTYHSRWKNLDQNKNAIDYFVNGFLSYGHPVTMVVNSFESNWSTDKKSTEINQRDIEYIKRIIEFCNSESIDLVFTSTPYVCSISEQMDINYLKNIIEESNIQFINYNEDNKIIDYEVDLYNIGHVNAVGARKVTESIGKLLIENYLGNIIHDQSEKKRWDKKYNQYIQLKLESIWACDDLDGVLMLLNDKDFSSNMYCQSSELILPNCTNKLINNVRTIQKNNVFEMDFQKFNELTNGIAYDEEADAYITLCDDDGLVLLKSFIIDDDNICGKTEYVNIKPEFLFDK